MHGGIVNHYTALGHDLFKVAQHQRIGRVPAHAHRHDLKRIVQPLCTANTDCSGRIADGRIASLGGFAEEPDRYRGIAVRVGMATHCDGLVSVDNAVLPNAIAESPLALDALPTPRAAIPPALVFAPTTVACHA
jgi:hypothetical protein